MIGRPIKSGLQIKTEQAIIDGTNQEGFLHKSKIKHLDNRLILYRLLSLWGFTPKHNDRGNFIGWHLINKKTQSTNYWRIG